MEWRYIKFSPSYTIGSYDSEYSGTDLSNINVRPRNLYWCKMSVFGLARLKIYGIFMYAILPSNIRSVCLIIRNAQNTL